jgi:hypothetical protein
MQSKYNAIILKFKTKQKLKNYFHVDCDSMFQSSLGPYIILPLSTLLNTIEELQFEIAFWHTQSGFQP